VASFELRTKNMCEETEDCKGYPRQNSPFTNRVLHLGYSVNVRLFPGRRWSLFCNFEYQVYFIVQSL